MCFCNENKNVRHSKEIDVLPLMQFMQHMQKHAKTLC